MTEKITGNSDPGCWSSGKGPREGFPERVHGKGSWKWNQERFPGRIIESINYRLELWIEKGSQKGSEIN